MPASFDAAARELTVEAALAAGIEHLTLLEEPQAALYAWIARTGDAWRKEITRRRRDPGGRRRRRHHRLLGHRRGRAGRRRSSSARVAVGDHILLGGDNMDLALAHVVRAEARGRRARRSTAGR